MIYQTLTILPLYKEWIYSFFSKMRASICGTSGAYTSLVLALCCLFVGINLIKTIIALSSDDKGSGFSNISVSQLVRPFIFILLILSFSTVFTAFDSLVSRVSTSIAASIPQEAPSSYASVMDQLNKTEEQLAMETLGRKLTDKDFKNNGKLRRNTLDAAADAAYAKNDIGAKTSDAENQLNAIAEKMGYQPTLDVFATALSTVGGYASTYTQSPRDYLEANRYRMSQPDLERVDDLEATVDYGKNYKQNFFKNWRDMESASRKTARSRDTMAVTICWVFDQLFYVMICLSELYLLILAAFGPIVLSLCILDSWRELWKPYVGKYIEISFWKVIAAIICWGVCNVRAAADSFTVDMAASNLTDLAAGSVLEGSLPAAWVLKAIFSLAGIFAFLTIPSLASILFGIAGSTGNLSDGIGEMRKFVGGATGAAVKMFGGKKEK